MPFASRKQQKFMFAVHPRIANRWRREGRAYISPGGKKDDRKKHFKGDDDNGRSGK